MHQLSNTAKCTEKLTPLPWLQAPTVTIMQRRSVPQIWHLHHLERMNTLHKNVSALRCGGLLSVTPHKLRCFSFHPMPPAGTINSGGCTTCHAVGWSLSVLRPGHFLPPALSSCRPPSLTPAQTRMSHPAGWP